MAINWSHLPRSVLDKICMNATKECTRAFALDKATGYWVCTGCKKPAVQVAVRECDICDKVFVPQFYDKILYAWAGIACDQCEEPRQTKGQDSSSIQYVEEYDPTVL